MALFPIFLDVRGRRALIVGAGATALRKACALIDFGMRVDVVAPVVCAPLERLADESGVRLFVRPYETADLDDAMLAVASVGDMIPSPGQGELCVQRPAADARCRWRRMRASTGTGFPSKACW